MVFDQQQLAILQRKLWEMLSLSKIGTKLYKENFGALGSIKKDSELFFVVEVTKINESHAKFQNAGL